MAGWRWLTVLLVAATQGLAGANAKQPSAMRPDPGAKEEASAPFPDHRPSRLSLPKGKILDMHVHVAGIGAGGSGCFLTPGIRESFKFGIYLHAFDVSEKELLDSGDGLIFDRMQRRMQNTRKIGGVVILALDGVIRDGKLDTNATQIYVPGDFVRRETLRHPGMYYGASINPYRPRALQKLRQAALEGAVLVKWIPSIMHIDPADTNLTAFYLEMARLHLPLLTHTGTERAFLSARDSLGDPRRLRLPLNLGVTVIAAHAGVPGRSDGKSYRRMLQGMFAEYPNLYADISSLTQVNKLGSLHKLAEDSLTLSRLVYGSDYPLNFTRLVSPLYQVYSLGIAKVNELKSMPEHWDRDVALKKALGMPADVFARAPLLLLAEKPKGVAAPKPARKTRPRKKKAAGAQ